MTDLDLMLRFLLQMVAILTLCRVLGWLGQRYLGQTQVVMEMVAGVVLGPSLFGLLMPQWQAWLFPRETLTVIQNGVETQIPNPSMSVLYVVAQLGLVLYMFLVGLEFNLDLVRHRARGAVAVSLAGVLVPLALGALLGLATHGRGDLFGPGISPWNGALYMGAAMCITAFPMLARIIYERGISGTPMGTLALGAGATDDAIAWSMLAVVLAVGKNDPMIALYAIGGGILFGALVITLGRSMFAYFGRVAEREGRLTLPAFISTMVLLMLGAWFTDAIGIYAVFGAFVIGAAMPRGRFAEEMRARLEMPTVGILLPFFFVYSGLNTRIGLLNTPSLWLLCLGVVLVAIFAKGAACTLAARLTGEAWRESFAIGTLMNARGLMELIILNIGLQQGVITPTLFTIMVIMAIVTTLMASPIFQRIYRDVDPAAHRVGTLATTAET